MEKEGVGDEFIPYISIVVPVSLVEEEMWSSGERFRSEIFFQPSENYTNFKRRTTFISNIQNHKNSRN